MTRCSWAESTENMKVYHDEVWGVPVFDDRDLFRKLVLDLNQAGLSWQTILNKTAAFDEAYEGFVIEKVAAFDEAKIQELLQNPGIIRNKLKVRAAVNNAQQVLLIQQEWGSFSEYLWQFVDGTPEDHAIAASAEIPAKTPLSDTIAKDLKKRGFKFVGSTTIYAFLQAVGIVNDHLLTCPRHAAVKALAKKI